MTLKKRDVIFSDGPFKYRQEYQPVRAQIGRHLECIIVKELRKGGPHLRDFIDRRAVESLHFREDAREVDVHSE